MSLDLFGGERSTNVANYFTAGLKGRWQEERRDDDHQLTDVTAAVDVVVDGRIETARIPALTALNQDLRSEYFTDCNNGVRRWNRLLETAGIDRTLVAPAPRIQPACRRVRRAARHTRVASSSTRRPGSADQAEWLPTAADYDHVQSLMTPVVRAGEDGRLDRAAGDRDQRSAGRLRVRPSGVGGSAGVAEDLRGARAELGPNDLSGGGLRQRLDDEQPARSLVPRELRAAPREYLVDVEDARPVAATANATARVRPSAPSAPTTAASATPSCPSSTLSTSVGDTHSPPTLSMSSRRPRWR